MLTIAALRSRCTCIADSTPLLLNPTEAEDACSKTDAECLQRAVEGKAASDEEEEDRAVKKHSARLHGCSKGCQSRMVHPLPSVAHLHDKNLVGTFNNSWKRSSREGRNQEQPEGSTGVEDEKSSEEDRTQLEQKEKARLSLLEEKLRDALTLLMQLRNKNVSRRALGKIVMDTLDVCSRSGDGPSQVLQVADALCVQLSSRTLLGHGRDDETKENREKLPVPSSGCQSTSINPLLISC